MTYDYTADPVTRMIGITDDSGIDAARLIAFAQALEPEFPRVFGDDNVGGLMREQRPKWSFELSVRGVIFKTIVVKTLTMRDERWAVVAEPVEPRSAVQFESERVEKIYSKQSFSQLADSDFTFEISDARREVLVRCDWLDTQLLGGIIGRLQIKDNAYFYLDPAYPVFFEMGGRRFRVDRNGAELMLVPTEDWGKA